MIGLSPQSIHGSQDEREDTADLREWINNISKQTERIDQIIKSLRRFGRPGSNRTRFPIGEAIEEALLVSEGYTRNAVGRIETDCEENLPMVFADQIQIEQVLVNLIQNACDAMGELPINQRDIRIEAWQARDAVVVSVTDSGPGISFDLETDIFNTFFTTKAEGVGVGLAISRSIIESHGGKIEAPMIESSKERAYGRINFTLPIKQESRFGFPN